jgi:PIN domain nuclease of toxin-antitoxin system
MQVLLDTHVLLWFFAGNSKLSDRVKDLIDDPSNIKFISTVSIWEMTIKQGNGKLSLETTAASYVQQKLVLDGFQLLTIEISHLESLASLPMHHNDPFDRLLIAQAISENFMLASCDQAFAAYSVQLIW